MSATTPKPRILTIEDDAAIRRGIVDALRFAGYGVLEAGRGDRGWNWRWSRSSTCLLLDLCCRAATGWKSSARSAGCGRPCR